MSEFAEQRGKEQVVRMVVMEQKPLVPSLYQEEKHSIYTLEVNRRVEREDSTGEAMEAMVMVLHHQMAVEVEERQISV